MDVAGVVSRLGLRDNAPVRGGIYPAVAVMVLAITFRQTIRRHPRIVLTATV